MSRLSSTFSLSSVDKTTPDSEETCSEDAKLGHPDTDTGGFK